AVLYPLSYGRFNTKARQPEQERRQSETERIPGFGQTVHRTAYMTGSGAHCPPSGQCRSRPAMRVNAC
ncbi:hypothetical protein P0D75_43205, partial [Paraburkholderia sediminicola]|uniref:hypothetical protein n=1 Tax=Paraburkholderia sediminicola TaxID=458836 RepID=UPI0038BC10C5